MYGYSSSIYRNICLTENPSKNIIRVYMLPVLVLVAIDCFFTYAILKGTQLFPAIFKNQIIALSDEYWLTYALCIPLFINVSIYFSSHFYKRISKNENQKMNTNFFGSLILIIASACFIKLIENNQIGYIETAAIIVLSFLFVLFTVLNIKSTKNFAHNFLK